MNRFPSILASVILAVSSAAAQEGQREDPLSFLSRLGSDVKVDSKSSAEFDGASKKFIWHDGIRIKLSDAEIFCERAELDTQLEQIHVTKNVSIYRGGMLYRGEEANYNIRTSEIDASHLRSSFEPVFFTTDSFKSKTEEVSVLNLGQTEFTTDDNPEPGWMIKAKEVRIYPDDRIVFVQPKAYVGKVPVFWLPYLAQPLNDELGYQFTPGYRSQWGAYLLNKYGVLWGDHSIVQYQLDIRSDRGFAGGINVLSRKWKENAVDGVKPAFGRFQAYYANDTSPETTVFGNEAEARKNIDADRYRINFQHRVYLPGPDESTLYVDFDINRISDEFFYEDFFPAEFRLDPQPDNFITLTKQHERGEANLLTRFRANDFYDTDTRLPELSFDFLRQPIGKTGLFYWGNTSFGIYNEELGDRTKSDLELRIDRLEARKRGYSLSVDENGRRTLTPIVGSGTLKTLATPVTLANGGKTPNESLLFTEDDQTMLDDLKRQVADRGFTRLHSYHEILYPYTFGDWLNVTPKLGAGVTNYSSVDGPSPSNSTRGLFHAGLDISFKASKLYDNVKWDALGVDSLLHVVQPYVSYSYLASDDLGKDFGKIDRLVPSTRLRPLDVPQFTAIDDLNKWNIVRFGVENRLLTRRNNGTMPWLISNTYFDTFIDDPESFRKLNDDGTFGDELSRDFSNLYQDIRWTPLPWLAATFGAQIPVFGGDLAFSEVNTALTFMPTDKFEFTIGHRFIQDHPFFRDSDVLDFSTYTRLTENWGLSTYHRYEFEDSTMQIQQYSLHRDLTSWTAAFGFVLRDHAGGDKETGVLFSLTLKDFPSVSVPLDLDASGGN